MKDLTRIKVDKFKIENSITLNELEKNIISNKNIEEENYIYTAENIFNEKQKIILDDRKKELFLNGVMLTFKDNKDGLYRIYTKNDVFLGLGIIKESLLKRDVIL